MHKLFGITVSDVQIPAIIYSKEFVASVEVAMKAKNESIAAENTVNRARYEGQQRVISASADAEALVARANADRQVRILQAEGEARAIELKSQAEAASIRVRGEAARGQSGLVEMVLAERWNGQPPHTILGQGQNAVPFFNISPSTATPMAKQ